MLFSNTQKLQDFLERTCHCSKQNAKPFTTIISVHPRTAQTGSWRKVDFRQKVWNQFRAQFLGQMQTAQNLDPHWCMTLVFGAPENARETDLDNYAKSTLDALKNWLLGDDSTIHHLELVKARVKADRPTVYGDPFFIGIRLARGTRASIELPPGPPPLHQNKFLTEKLRRLEQVIDMAYKKQLFLGKAVDWVVTETHAVADETSWIVVKTASGKKITVTIDPTHEILMQYKVNLDKVVINVLPEVVADLIIAS